MRLIDADKLTNFLDESVPDSDICISQYNADWIYSFIESAPTIDPVVHDWWEVGGKRMNEHYCVICGYVPRKSKLIDKDEYKHCPSCGAKMDANNSTEQKM